MGHFLKLNFGHLNVRIKASTSVHLDPTTVQKPNLALIETKGITVHSQPAWTEISTFPLSTSPLPTKMAKQISPVYIVQWYVKVGISTSHLPEVFILWPSGHQRTGFV
jgi:hypothetical protein